MLNDLACKKATPSDTPRKLSDSAGLYLLVNAAGKYWRMDYRFEGKRKTLALGVYPEVGLKDARQARDEARAKLAQGEDPSAAKRAAKQRIVDSFEEVARDWHARFKIRWKPDHADTILRRLETQVFPYIGAVSIGAIEPPDLLDVLRRIEGRGAHELAHKMSQTCGQVFRYGIATGKCRRDLSADLRGALTPSISRHHAAITEPQEIGKLLRAIDSYDSAITRAGLQLAALLFLRPGELRKGEWAEVDLDDRLWRVPGARMKMGSAHLVPLSDQAIAVLRQLQELTGFGALMFPGHNPARPMSENTLTGALRRLGFAQGVMTAHGFRSTASTRLHELGWPEKVVELQLAHAERDKVAAAYNRAERLPERRKMMQAWADYLDALRAA